MERRTVKREQANRTWGLEETIRTKLYIPNARENWVPRPRLLERLDESFKYPLTLLVAPAGYGKTTLLSDWIHSRQESGQDGDQNASGMPLNAGWVTLDERDNDLERFVIYLAGALETLEIFLDDGFWARRLRQEGMEASLGALINRVAEVPDNFILVLDDFQVITAPPVYQALTFLLNHLPPQMHLILSCRSEPALALGQLRARGQLHELGAADLRFLTEETAAFLKHTMGLDLPEEALSALEMRTEGWVAGLQLAALSMRGQQNAMDFIQAFTGSHRYIVDYLADQVLHQQPVEIQNFLLESSLLGQLSQPNCEAILGEQDIRIQEVLEYLEKANLFLAALDHERQWYRYHPLFADFLRDRLRRSNPERWSELHRKAVDWYIEKGWIAEAVDHSLAIGDARQAADLVEKIIEAIWMKGEMARLWRWLQALPDEMVRGRPRLCIFHAWISNIKGEIKVRDARLADVAESIKHGDLPVEERELILGMQATLQGIASVMEGDAVATKERCLEALEQLPEENFVWRCVVYRNLGNAYLLGDEPLAARLAFREALESSLRGGNIYMALISMYELGELDISLGRLRQAEQTFRSALQLAEERGAPGLTITGAIHTGLSEVLRQWDRLEEGIRHARAGIELGLLDGSIGVQLCGNIRLAAIAKASGNTDEADQALNKAMALAPSLRQTAFIAHTELQGRLWWIQEDLVSAKIWVKESGLHPDGEISCQNEAGYLALARLLMREGSLEAADSLLSRLAQTAGKAGRRGRLIEVLALKALVCRAMEDQPAALAALEEGLVLAETEGHLRVFLDEGQPMRSLLGELKLWIEKRQPGQSKDGDRSLLAYVDRLQAAFPHSPVMPMKIDSGEYSGADLQPSSTGLVEPLSGRELEILRLIAAGLSNPEIAQELVVATSTVQWHTKNIYSKLNVHSRTQATWQARQLGLVS
jgi:LuxR family transcriptional regulator, maltose regulon positive regulatory protein